MATRPFAMLVNVGVLTVTTNLTIFIVSAALPVEQSSLWFMCLSAAGLLFMTDMGISYAISRYLARSHGGGARGHIGGAGPLVMRFFLRSALVPFFLVSTVLAGYLVLVRIHSGRPSYGIPGLLGLWGLVAAYSLLAVLAKYLQMANEGVGKLWNERLIVAASQLCTFAIAGPALLITRQIWVLPVASIAGFGAQSLLLYRSLSAGGGDAGQALEESALDAVRKDSRSLWLLSVMTLISQNVQVMSLAWIARPASIAAFFFMQRIDGGAGNLVGMLPIVDRSRITYHYTRGEARETLRVITRNVRLVMLASTAATLCFAGVAIACNHYALLKFPISRVYIVFFCIDLLLTSATGALAQYVLAVGRNPFLYWVMACTAMTVLLQFVLVPRFGGIGALWAWMIAQLLTTNCAATVYFVRLVRELRSTANASEAKCAA